MPIEKSAGAIIFRKEKDTIMYLLLHYPTSRRNTKKEYWDLPKGHIEKGENIEDTVKREVEEETGLNDIRFVKGFKEWIKYFFKVNSRVPIRISRGRRPSEGYSHTIFKIVTFLLAETKTKNIKISFEHKGFKWLPYQEALEQLTFKNAKEILKKANDYLSKESSQRG